MKRKKLKWSDVPWTSFEPGVHRDDPTIPYALKVAAAGDLVFLNSRYQVDLTYHRDHPWGLMAELSIKTRDKQAHHDWRDLQRIKNELLGPEWEGVEVYPAESRLVDTANQYYLWCFEKFRFPFGFQERVVAEGAWKNSVQRPFDHGARPADCLTAEAWAKKAGVR